ncbi:MAG: rod shape-determining protein [Firmicutes bacterium]|jgi:rod shape-determining protein MreB|nr:rod shape-determining protein [Bacillota bacterium]NLO65163.1 rod shape-determining protein [Bacillota bacterium]
MFGKDIGIDLGTANILIYVRGQGVVIHEPSVVAVDVNTQKICALGAEAREMIGRTPGNIRAIRPLNEGVIADFRITEEILKHFIKKVAGRGFFRPRIMICIPSGITTVEKRAVLEAATQAGAREVYLITEPIAAAIGCGLDITAPSGNMVVDIGGGTTDIAVISLGGEVTSESLRIGGGHMEEAIQRYVQRFYNLAIGDRTAEEIKITVASAYPNQVDRKMSVRGRDLVTGLPATVEISAADIYPALEEPITSIVDAIRSVLEVTPPELSADIINKGMALTGGGALLDGIARLIQERTGVPVMMVEDPLTCAVRGTGEALDNLDKGISASPIVASYTRAR